MEFLVGFATAAIHGLAMVPLARLPWRVPMLVVQVVFALLLHATSVEVLMWLGLLGEYWWLAASFGFGFMVYLFGFSALYKSLSLRILVDVLAHDPDWAQLEGVYQRVIERSFRERIEILERGGLVARQGALYAATARGLALAGRIGRLRTVLGVVGGGIYFAKRPAPGGREAGR